jgi:hypothetical protein
MVRTILLQVLAGNGENELSAGPCREIFIFGVSEKYEEVEQRRPLHPQKSSVCFWQYAFNACFRCPCKENNVKQLPSNNSRLFLSFLLTKKKLRRQKLHDHGNYGDGQDNFVSR